ncbi:hypothetical protein A7982_12384 [Minicystis rosea]|nr:hypothetical protein A7982_12384 [Minicystis rosea]
MQGRARGGPSERARIRRSTDIAGHSRAGASQTCAFAAVVDMHESSDVSL